MIMHTHQPVLLDTCLEYLEAETGGWYLDATFGTGGHTRALLDSSSHTRVVALDQDPDAETHARELHALYGERFTFYRQNFSTLQTQLNTQLDGRLDGILFDLGVSSCQLDKAERGFSFRFDASLDMRMNPDEGAPASHFLNHASTEQLIRAIRDYGEERRWKRVVHAVHEARGGEALQRTTAFAELVARAVGPAGKHAPIHPATRTFQGVRIAVNKELEALELALPTAFSLLRSGGKLLVISFHSLEDRIVKRFFRRMAGKPEHGRDSRSQMEREALANILTPRPIQPDEQEIAQNRRSRSARLRVLCKQTNGESDA